MVTINRAEAVATIRKRLLDMVDEDHSMCQVASERGVYCCGFGRLTDEQLRQRYSWLLKNNPRMSREALEQMANRWELARQTVNRVPIACDSQTLEKDTCAGWENFDDATIARFYQELVGEQIRVADPAPS
jgi:hypothetical protein